MNRNSIGDDGAKARGHVLHFQRTGHILRVETWKGFLPQRQSERVQRPFVRDGTVQSGTQTRLALVQVPDVLARIQTNFQAPPGFSSISPWLLRQPWTTWGQQAGF